MGKRLSFLLVLIALAAVGLFVWSKRSKTEKPVVPLANIPFLPPAPTLTEHQSQIVVSPNMEATLTMEEHKDKTAITHTVLASLKNGAPLQVFTKTIDASQTLTIPFNTWSPDNKYFFLKESGAGSTNYIVLSSDGKAVFKGSQSVAVEDLFAKKYQNYKITDVTGWAAPTLLVINTDKVGGGVGPSLWLDVSTLSFTQLATRFN